MVITSGAPRRLGTSDAPMVSFAEEPKPPGTWAGRRVLQLDDAPAFELSYWCGTCPCLFKRLDGANHTTSLSDLSDALTAGLDDLDNGVISRYSELLAADDYLPLLLEITPQLVLPGQPGDYFSEEQVTTWGIDDFWGLPEYPATAYYRTFETEVTSDAHLYEFVVPMVPPTWNDRERVNHFIDAMESTARPTAVAVSTLDIAEPADPDGPDYFAHWMLTHFLLDGHHKVEAAAIGHRRIRLLSLVAVDASIATPDEVKQLQIIRTQPRSPREAPSAPSENDR